MPSRKSRQKGRTKSQRTVYKVSSKGSSSGSTPKRSQSSTQLNLSDENDASNKENLEPTTVIPTQLTKEAPKELSVSLEDNTFDSIDQSVVDSKVDSTPPLKVGDEFIMAAEQLEIPAPPIPTDQEDQKSDVQRGNGDDSDDDVDSDTEIIRTEAMLVTAEDIQVPSILAADVNDVTSEDQTALIQDEPASKMDHLDAESKEQTGLVIDDVTADQVTNTNTNTIDNPNGFIFEGNLEDFPSESKLGEESTTDLLSNDTPSDSECSLRAQQLVSGVQRAIGIGFPLLLSDYAKYLNDLSKMASYLGLSYPLPGNDDRIKFPLNEDRRFAGLKIQERMRFAFKHACLMYDPKLLVKLGLLKSDNVKGLESWMQSTVPTLRVVSELAFPDTVHHSHQSILLDRTMDSSESSLRDAIRRLSLIRTRVIKLRRILGGFDGLNCNNDAAKLEIPSRLPSYYLCLDSSEAAVVLSVSGRRADWDFDMTSVEPRGCYAASGIWKAAFWVTVDVLNSVEKALKNNPTFRMVIVGHSLGAAVASCVSCMLGRILPQFRHRIDGFAFGSPPVMSAELAFSCSDIVKSVVIGNDMITRLNRSSVNQITQRVRMLAEKDESEPKFYSELQQFLNLMENGQNVAQFEEFMSKVLFDWNGGDEIKPDLHLAGQILWYVPRVTVDGTKPVNEVRRMLMDGSSLIDRGSMKWEDDHSYFSDVLDEDQMLEGLVDFSRAMVGSGERDNVGPSVFKVPFVFVDATEMRSMWNHGLSLDPSLTSVLTHLPNFFAPAVRLDRLDESVDSSDHSWFSDAASTLAGYLLGSFLSS